MAQAIVTLKIFVDIFIHHMFFVSFKKAGGAYKMISRKTIYPLTSLAEKFILIGEIKAKI